MDPIKSEDLKVAESKNPIEALLQQTGWSLEDAVLRLSDYKSNTLESNGKISDTKSDMKAEVKEEISDYRRQFMSVNKREEESDSDVEIIEEASDKMFDTNCGKISDTKSDIKAEVKEEISDYRTQFMSVNKREEESDSDVEIIEEASDKMFDTNCVKISDTKSDMKAEVKEEISDYRTQFMSVNKREEESDSDVEIIEEASDKMFDTNCGKISDTKSDMKAEVKEEISDYRRQFMSVNKREEESDSDVEIIEEASDKMFDTNVQDSETSIKIIDNAPDLSNKSTVIDTNSFSDKSENTCVLLTDETVNFNKTNTKVREKLKIKNLPMKYKKKYILKKCRYLKKMRWQREIEKAEKQAAVVGERLKLQLGLLREKKKPELKFLCSQPDYSQTDAQNVSENPAIVHNESVVGGKKWQEESNDMLEIGDSDLMIVDDVGGYESPVQEETNDDIVDLSNLKDENGMEMEYHLNSMESVVSLLYGQYGNSFQSKVLYHTVPQICDMMTDCLDIEMKEVLSPNENLLSEDNVCNSNNLIEQSLELTTEEVLKPNESSLASNEISEDDHSNLKICENIESPECTTEEVLNPNENRSASKEISEDDQCNSSNCSKTTAKTCENIEQSPEFTTDAVLKPNEYPSASNTNILSEDESNSSSHSKTNAKLKIWENIKQKLEFTNNANTEANLELLQCDKTKSTGTFMRSLSANIFTKPIPNAITPTKTKDITKIKGWKNKRFVECKEGKSTMTKESSIIQTQKENILSDTFPFVSTKQLDQAPTVFTASNINEPSTSSAGLVSPSISTISTEVIAPTVFTASNINEPSTSAAGLASPSISTISTEVIAPTVFTASNINEPSTSAAGLATPSISTISTKVIASSEHNIAPSPGEDLDLHTAVISTTSIIMSTSNTPTIAHSETSSVSTISTVAPVLSVSTAVLTNSNVPSTSSTSDAHIKPYKPKTPAEKRRLLEESKLPLTAELIFSMNREQRQSNRSRILKYRNQLVRNEGTNGKRLKVTSHKNDQVLTYIKNRKKVSKTQYMQARSKTPRVSNIKKPSLLESLKEPIKEEKYDATQWETVEVKLPKVSISVVPQYGQVLHPGLEHLIGNETWFLSENRVRFALSLLRTTAKPKLNSFKFPLCYANQETTMKMKKKMPVVVKPDEFVRTESDDAIQVGVNSVIEKLLNNVDILDEIKKPNIQVENVENTTEKPSLPVPEVVQTIKRYTGPRSKINKTALEMKRLNCKIVSVANDKYGTDNENCTKEVCKLGCICKTLPYVFTKNNNNMDSTSLPSGNNLLNAGVINRLQYQAKKNLAKIVVLSEDDLFSCKLCNDGSTFRGERKSMVTHLLKIHKERIYICDVCGQYFRKNPELTSHMKEHLATEQGDFQCEVCNRIFTSLRLFKIHKRMHAPQNKAWNCEICQKKFGSKNLLSEHFNIHTGARPYQCGICKKSYSSKYTFKSHEKTHDDSPRPFKCTECTKCFLTQQNLNQHKRTHSGLKEFACLQCDKEFGTAHSLRVHSIIHTGCKPFICEHCHKGFARRAEITDHLRTHTGERPFECNMCKDTFAQRSNLQSHKRCTHWNDKRYKCQHCVEEVGFKRRRLLDYHIRVCHTGERPYKCDICLATFVYPEHFKNHKRVHTGEKPHSCPICLKKFSSRDNRNSHLFTHSDKKPYECAICGLCFMRKPLLMQHMSKEKHESNVILLNQLRMKINDQCVTITSNGEILGNEPLTLQPIQTGAKEDSTLGVLEGNVVLMDDDSFVIVPKVFDL